MLEIKSIYKTFNAGTVNEKRALQGIDLHLKEGDFVTVIGGSRYSLAPALFIARSFRRTEGAYATSTEQTAVMAGRLRASSDFLYRRK